MALPGERIVLVSGEDEFLIAEFIGEMETGLGDPTTASMNTTRIEANQFSAEAVRNAALSMPFLAARRLVMVNRPYARLTTADQQRKFLEILEKLPGHALVLLVDQKIPAWMEAWRKKNPGVTAEKNFTIPKNGLPEWISRRARKQGGEFTPRAAALLAEMSNDDPRYADQEIQKLLTFVNLRRPVDFEDVEQLTVSISQADIFALVDALGHQDGKKAMGTLMRLLADKDPLYDVYPMIVRQFRLLIQARELIEKSVTQDELAREMRIHPFVAGKLAVQARRFSSEILERAHHGLMELEYAIKTGKIEDETGLETWVAGFTTQKA